MDISDILPTLIGTAIAGFSYLLKGKFDDLSRDIKSLGQSVHELSHSVMDLKDDIHARSLETKDCKLECQNEINNLRLEIQKRPTPERIAL